MCEATIFEVVFPSSAANLSPKAEGKLGFLPNTIWYGLDPLTLFKVFLATTAQQSDASQS